MTDIFPPYKLKNQFNESNVGYTQTASLRKEVLNNRCPLRQSCPVPIILDE